MKFFTVDEFKKKYNEFIDLPIQEWSIEAVCEMIFSQIGTRLRNTTWNEESVPFPIKQASMEQLRFQIEHDLPFVDIDKSLKAGSMDVNLKSDYSTLALRILANNGYLYRGSEMNSNMSIDIPFGG